MKFFDRNKIQKNSDKIKNFMKFEVKYAFSMSSNNLYLDRASIQDALLLIFWNFWPRFYSNRASI